MERKHGNVSRAKDTINTTRSTHILNNMTWAISQTRSLMRGLSTNVPSMAFRWNLTVSGSPAYTSSALKVYSLICVLLLAGSCWRAGAVLATGIHAIVHDSVVTYEQVATMTRQTADVLRRQYSRQPLEFEKRMAKVQEENLERLTEWELILHEFQTAGYAMPDTAINDMVESRVRATFGDRRTAAKTLQAQGMTYDKYRELEKRRYIVEAMRSKNISSEIMISPQKIENYYQANPEKFKVEDQVKMRLIVRSKTSESTGSNARKICDEILMQLKQGASFAEMASLYSQSSEATKTGGERPWDMVSDLVTELREAVVKLNVGEISDVIETEQSCYIVKVEGKKLQHTKPLADVRDEIEQDLLALERERLEKLWIAKLKKKTFVKYFP